MLELGEVSFCNPRQKGIVVIKTAIISIEMMRDSMPGDQATEWGGIECEKQRTKN